MKRILINMIGMGDGRLFSPDARDNCCEPFIYLRNILRTRGYELDTLDERNVKGSAGVWFWDVPNIQTPRRLVPQSLQNVARTLGLKYAAKYRPTIYDQCVMAGLKDQMVLFIGEPPAVLP